MEAKESELLSLSSFLNENNIFLDLHSTNKAELIVELSQKVCLYAPDVKYNLLLADLTKREDECSTGIGYNIAIPHTKTEATDKLVIILALHSGIDFHSFDGKPAKLFFVIAIPQNYDESYRKILSKLSKMLRNKEIREKLISSKNKQEVISIIQNYESNS